MLLNQKYFKNWKKPFRKKKRKRLILQNETAAEHEKKTSDA